MVAHMTITHVFKYPVDKVADLHLTKYPTEKEPNVIKVEIREHKMDHVKGTDYQRRWAYCQNNVPQVLRIISLLDEKEIIFEEEAWLDLHNKSLRVESKNISFSDYAQMWEESTFKPSDENPNWTIFEQHGEITVYHLGLFNRVLEIFAKKLFTQGALKAYQGRVVMTTQKNNTFIILKALQIMEEILYERSLSQNSLNM